MMATPDEEIDHNSRECAPHVHDARGFRFTFDYLKNLLNPVIPGFLAATGGRKTGTE